MLCCCPHDYGFLWPISLVRILRFQVPFFGEKTPILDYESTWFVLVIHLTSSLLGPGERS